MKSTEHGEINIFKHKNKSVEIRRICSYQCSINKCNLR